MTPQQKIEIDSAARALVRCVREGNEAAVRDGGKKLDNEEYKALEDELRQLLSRQAERQRVPEPTGC